MQGERHVRNKKQRSQTEGKGRNLVEVPQDAELGFSQLGGGKIRVYTRAISKIERRRTIGATQRVKPI